MKISSPKGIHQKARIKVNDPCVRVKKLENDTEPKQIRKMKMMQMSDVQAGICVRLFHYKEKSDGKTLISI